MRTALSFAALGALLAAGVPAAPALAQAGNEKILIVFGNDPCPTSNGEEIVVCARKPEGERYRIPEQLRRTTKASDLTGADRVSQLEATGRFGTSSCTPTGAGGWTGCWSQVMRQVRAERQQAAAGEPVLD